MGNLKDKTVKGVFWSAFNRFSTQGLGFVFNIIIARRLLPEDYGVIAILYVFLEVSSCFIDSGFTSALIRKQNRTEEDFSTVFYYNFVIALLCYTVLWFAAPYIAAFYNIPLLTSVTRVVGIGIILGAIQGVMGIKLTIALDFKTITKITIPINIITGLLSLIMVYNDFGVWTLVYPNLIAGVFNIVILWFNVRWLPSLVFSWKSFREMFSYGSKLLISSIIDKIYANISTIVVGKCFSPAALGVYNRAVSLSGFASSNVTGILQGVAFPVLSSIQNDSERLQNAYSRFMRMSVFIVFPLILGLSAVADPFIRILLTDKWEGAIYFLQIICFSMMWYPVNAINLRLLQVKGRSDYFLKLEVIKKIQGILILCITVPFGLVAMCYGSVVSSLIGVIWNAYYTKKVIGYCYCSQMRDIIPVFLHSLVMCVLVHVVIYFIPTLWLRLVMGIAVGIAYYISGAYLMKFRELDEALTILKLKKAK